MNRGLVGTARLAEGQQVQPATGVIDYQYLKITENDWKIGRRKKKQKPQTSNCYLYDQIAREVQDPSAGISRVLSLTAPNIRWR